MFFNRIIFLAGVIKLGVLGFWQQGALANPQKPWVQVKCAASALTVLDGLYNPLENDVRELSLTVSQPPNFYPRTVPGSVEIQFSSTSPARRYLNGLGETVSYDSIPLYLNRDESYDSRAGFASMWKLFKLGINNLRTDSQVLTLTGSSDQPVDDVGLITREIIVQSFLHTQDAKANNIFVKLNAFEGNDAIRHLSFDIKMCDVR